MQISELTAVEDLISSQPIFVKFYKDGCAPCKAIQPVLEELAKQYDGQISMNQMDIMAVPDAIAKYGLRGVPTFAVIQNGNVLDMKVGEQPKSSIEMMISSNIIDDEL